MAQMECNDSQRCAWKVGSNYKRRFGLVSSVCTKPKRLLEGVLFASSSPQARVLLPTMTSKWCCFAHQLRTYPPSMPTLHDPSGRGKRSHSLGLPSRKHGCSSPNSASRRLATLRVSYRTVLTSSVTSSGVHLGKGGRPGDDITIR